MCVGVDLHIDANVSLVIYGHAYDKSSLGITSDLSPCQLENGRNGTRI